MRAVLKVPWPALLAILGLLAPSLFTGAAALSLQTGHAQSGAAIGIDADPTGNSASLLGNRDTCIAVHRGQTFQVDVIAQNVSDLLAWEAYLSFDQNVVQVKDRDVQYLLASAPDANAFDISAPLSEGRYRVGSANISTQSTQPQGVTGSGVLARLSLQAQDSGLTSLSLAPIKTEVGTIGPTLTAADASHIGDSDGDGLFDGPVLDAQVAVEQSCPGGAGPAPVAPSENGSGTDWWVFVVAAVGGVVVLLGIGGGIFMARRRAGSRPKLSP